MKTFLTAFLTLMPTIAFAHPGHIQAMSAPVHAASELIYYGVLIVALAFLVLPFLRGKSSD